MDKKGIFGPQISLQFLVIGFFKISPVTLFLLFLFYLFNIFFCNLFFFFANQ